MAYRSGINIKHQGECQECPVAQAPPKCPIIEGVSQGLCPRIGTDFQGCAIFDCDRCGCPPLPISMWCPDQADTPNLCPMKEVDECSQWDCNSCDGIVCPSVCVEYWMFLSPTDAPKGVGECVHVECGSGCTKVDEITKFKTEEDCIDYNQVSCPELSQPKCPDVLGVGEEQKKLYSYFDKNGCLQYGCGTPEPHIPTITEGDLKHNFIIRQTITRQKLSQELEQIGIAGTHKYYRIMMWSVIRILM